MPLFEVPEMLLDSPEDSNSITTIDSNSPENPGSEFSPESMKGTSERSEITFPNSTEAILPDSKCGRDESGTNVICNNTSDFRAGPIDASLGKF